MKAKIKKTGEIINIADCARVTYDDEGWARVTFDACDSYGNPIELGLEEIKIIQDEKTAQKDIDWEQRRYDMAKDFTAIMLGRLNYDPFTAHLNCCCSDGEAVNPYKHIASIAVSVADALIAELKKNQRKEE